MNQSVLLFHINESVTIRTSQPNRLLELDHLQLCKGSLRPHAGQVETRCAGGKPYTMRRSYPNSHTATLHQFLSNCPACRNCARRRPTARVRACAHHGRGATSRRVTSSSTCRYLYLAAVTPRRPLPETTAALLRAPPAFAVSGFQLLCQPASVAWLQPQNTRKPPP